MSWLDFNNHEKGYKPFSLTKENVLANKGRKVVYIRKSDVDSCRGYCFPQYGILEDRKYSYVFFENGNQIDARDVIECGIEDSPSPSE